MITVRRAADWDVDRVLALLHQVLDVHQKLRPDLFKDGSTKYTEEQLYDIFHNEDTPVLVAVDEQDEVMGYAFCVVQKPPFSTTMKDLTTLYIDDLCVDENCRGQHVGKLLYEAALALARNLGCYDVTLNVWEGNSARAFYEKMGMFVKETTMEVIL